MSNLFLSLKFYFRLRLWMLWMLFIFTNNFGSWSTSFHIFTYTYVSRTNLCIFISVSDIYRYFILLSVDIHISYMYRDCIHLHMPNIPYRYRTILYWSLQSFFSRDISTLLPNYGMFGMRTIWMTERQMNVCSILLHKLMNVHFSVSINNRFSSILFYIILYVCWMAMWTISKIM